MALSVATPDGPNHLTAITGQTGQGNTFPGDVAVSLGVEDWPLNKTFHASFLAIETACFMVSPSQPGASLMVATHL